MAMTKCSHCEGGRFEIVTKEPTGTRYKLLFVQCAQCGAPVGVMDYLNIGAVLEGHGQRLERIESSLQSMEAALQQMVHYLRNR